MAADLIVFEGGGEGPAIPEPDWQALIPYPAAEDAEFSATHARQLAAEHWARVTDAMRAAGTLGAENVHQVQRLVLAYVRYDQAASEVARSGAVTKAPKTKVPMLSVWVSVLKGASEEASTIEAELGLTPRRRGAVTKVQTRKKKARAADGYMGAGRKA